MTEEEQLKADMRAFLALPNGTSERIVLRVIQMAGIFSAATDGSKDRHLAFDEGRRNLGLEFLAMVEQGQPATHSSGQPFLTILQALREEATKPQEKPHGRSDRYDRNRDLDDSDD